ncbi:hypothetical protein [Plebeiibacterium sediminum]|uniref:Uncharacterized protein n=1 Tax=Plebeiibacterium sediminum TaxID=2992112 RepID=A0AAE3SEJ0_9BACT|nr:hypothetical protein [Plebeiobacterium sediminum]MCW3785163.1 hypothetical protein [Plebeiobacterium sediminum]
MQRLLTLILILICFGCYQNNNKLSFVSLNFANKIQHNTDSISKYISGLSSDLIEIKTAITDSIVLNRVLNEDYNIISSNTENESTKTNSVLYANKQLIELLSSSTLLIKHDILMSELNIISWYKLKYLKSGYIFYVFKIDTQDTLNDKQIKLISYHLLKKVDEISAGAPVIILSNNISNCLEMSNILTNEWIDNYNFKAIKSMTNSCIKFYVNDFFKVINLNKDTVNTLSLCNIQIKFSLNTNNVERNMVGDQLNDLLIK